jgi:hypothetical protein
MFKLEFSTDTAAFDDDLSCHAETLRIFALIAECIRAGQAHGTIRDADGTAIGKWEFTP